MASFLDQLTWPDKNRDSIYLSNLIKVRVSEMSSLHSVQYTFFYVSSLTYCFPCVDDGKTWTGWQIRVIVQTYFVHIITWEKLKAQNDATKNKVVEGCMEKWGKKWRTRWTKKTAAQRFTCYCYAYYWSISNVGSEWNTKPSALAINSPILSSHPNIILIWMHSEMLCTCQNRGENMHRNIFKWNMHFIYF